MFLWTEVALLFKRIQIEAYKHIVEKYKKEKLLGLRIMVVNLTAHNPSFHSFVLPSLCNLITLAIPTLPLTWSRCKQTFYLLAFYPMLVEYHS